MMFVKVAEGRQASAAKPQDNAVTGGRTLPPRAMLSSAIGFDSKPPGV